MHQQCQHLPLRWLISAGPSEQPQAQELREQLATNGVVADHFLDTAGVDDFALQLGGADMLIAGPTGPLHVAGCLDIATAGLSGQALSHAAALANLQPGGKAPGV